jgi:acyl-CoA synthetase (AMP-forming)/AMP-acid ligase II
MINVAGRKVLPEVIEQVLATHPAVRECAVVGLPAAEPGRGEEIAAVVALRGTVSEAALRDFVAARLPAWQVPRRWRLVEGTLINRRGKLSKQALKHSVDWGY